MAVSEVSAHSIQTLQPNFVDAKSSTAQEDQALRKRFLARLIEDAEEVHPSGTLQGGQDQQPQIQTNAVDFLELMFESKREILSIVFSGPRDSN